MHKAFRSAHTDRAKEGAGQWHLPTQGSDHSLCARDGFHSLCGSFNINTENRHCQIHERIPSAQTAHSHNPGSDRAFLGGAKLTQAEGMLAPKFPQPWERLEAVSLECLRGVMPDSSMVSLA